MLDFKYWEEEAMILKQMLKNSEIEIKAHKQNAEQATKMLDEVVQRNAELVKKIDELTNEIMKRDLEELGK